MTDKDDPVRLEEPGAEDRIEIAGKSVMALRLSYVGEQGWELHMKYEDGLAVWDALRSTGVIAVGVETYANSRRMEKSLRLQNADLLTQYNLYEADLARPKVKEADLRGKAKHVEYRERDKQPAMLCTLVMLENTDAKGVKRYPVGAMPVQDPDTGKTEIVNFVAADDFGNIINPMIVEGQVHGGITQGIGQALLENASYDENGQLLTASYMDYCMPRADDLPAGCAFAARCEMATDICSASAVELRGSASREVRCVKWEAANG